MGTNIRISNEYSNAFLNSNIHIFSCSYFSFFFLSSFCLKFAFILAAPFLTQFSVKVGMNHPCKLRCQFDTLLF